MRFNPCAFQTAQQIAANPTAPVAVKPTPERSFILLYGRPDANRIAVPEMHTAVTLCLKHNDSAPQVDHFDYHAHLGCPAFLLLLCKKQSHTENLARKALGLVPSLHQLDWTWKSERYTGGHGNYLSSSPFAPPPALTINARQTYGGAPITTVFWEIEFTASHRGHTVELWPHREYGRAPLADTPNAREAATGPISAAWRLNEKFHGVEIKFTRRPEDPALAPLRADRAWRYSGPSQLWYAKQSPATVAFARDFVANFNNGTGTMPVVPQNGPGASPVPPARKIIHFVDLMRPKTI